jgi:hypothetical protein
MASTSPATINVATAGEVVACTGDGTVLNAAGATALAAGDVFYVVQSQGATLPPIWSPAMKKGQVVAKGGPFANFTLQVDYWGYDGINPTSEIDAISDNSYTLRVNMFDSMSFAEKSNAIIGYVATGTSPTQISIADAVTTMMIEHSRYLVKVPPITIERLSIVAPGGAALPSGNAAVVHGSQNVTSVAHALTVGSYVRFGAAVTSIIYKVAGVLSANVFILDVPYQGVTNPTIINAEVYTAVAVQAVPAGIKISVTDQPRSFPGVLGNDGEDYYFLTIQTSATGGGSTNLQTLYTLGGNNTHPAWGSGDVRGVFTAEQNYLGNEGYLDNRNSWPHVTPRSNVNTSALGFSIISLVWNDTRNMVIETANQRKELMLACECSGTTPNTFASNIDGGNGIADTLAILCTGFAAADII